MYPRGLVLYGSVNRASLCTASARNALVSVDNELTVALGNAGSGASICACAAADALVSNLVCHGCYLHKICLLHIL